ncbi:unnamed protein product [Nippostrongylus brasiliensis]|uniref:Aldo_ket_red domain-containing protein n=1 Tax=Nippostrongylus brasiliensis TaxID=27835 RepID=A0A0N4XFY0_NIPBR|nr:unnamed protein product [Nippostrongylus brasiliensis]
MPVPTVKLSSGFEMPVLGLGTWQSKPGELQVASDDRFKDDARKLLQVGKAVEIALNNGYTHIDCAWAYMNQSEIGEVLSKMFASTLKRENVFITSKVWNTFHSASACKKHVIEILDQLKLDYIDLMLIHWPMGYEECGEPFPKRPNSDKMKYSNEDYLTTWKVLEEFVKDGKVVGFTLYFTDSRL